MTTEAVVRKLIDEHLAAAVSGDEVAFSALVHEDFVQEWPQSGEQVRGRAACLNVMRHYPGGPPQIDFGRIRGEGDHWVVEGTSRYPDGSEYHMVAILEFREGKVLRETDYFGPSYPAPEWRKEWVEPLAS